MSWRARTRRLLPYIVMGAVGFLVAYLYVFFFVFPSDVVPTDARIPAVTGLSYDDAARRLDAAGFRAGAGEKTYHAAAPKQTVLSQNPRAGSLEPRGTRVLLDVSLGQRQTQVPQVVGLPSREAQLAIENAGLAVGDVRLEPSDAPRGQVLESTPAGGETVTLPSAVRLRASAGPATIEMPDLLGRPYAEARAALEQLGLSTGRALVDSTLGGLPNTVVRQEPGARQTVRAGSVVRLTVAP